MNQILLIRDKFTKQVHRTIHIGKGPLYVILLADQNRIDIVKDIKSLDIAGIKYDLIEKTSFTALKKTPLKIGTTTEIVTASESFQVAKDIPLKEEDNSLLTSIFKWSSGIQIGIVLVILLVAWIFKPEEIEKEPIKIVTVTPKIIQPIVSPGKPVKTQKRTNPRVTKSKRAAVQKKKITKKRANNSRVASRGNKSRKGRKASAKKPKQNSTAYRKQGALGALKTASAKGSVPNSRAGSARVSKTRMAGTPGKGSARSVIGKAIVKAKPGRGLRVGGTGSYSRQGFGKGGNTSAVGPSFQGRSNGYLEPLDAQAIVRGGLTQDQIASVIQRNLGQVLYCYESGLQKDPGISGRVAVNFVISPRGRVSTAKINQSSVDSRRVEGCIVNKLRGWSFPRPVGNVSVNVTYPFLLRRSS